MKKKTFYFLLATMAVAAFLLILFAPAGAQQAKVVKPIKTNPKEWTTASQFTFAWDVPTLADGSAVPAGDVIKYQPYLKPDGGTATAYGAEIANTQITVTLPAESRYRACAQAVRYPANSSERIVSEIACSDVAEVCENGQPWGVIYYIMINGPHGLKRIN